MELFGTNAGVYMETFGTGPAWVQKCPANKQAQLDMFQTGSRQSCVNRRPIQCSVWTGFI